MVQELSISLQLVSLNQLHVSLILFGIHIFTKEISCSLYDTPEFL